MLFWSDLLRPRPHVSGESGIRIRNFLNPLSRVAKFEYAMNSESCGRYIRTIRTFFFIQWRNKMELSSLPWILYSRRRPRPMLCCQYSWRSPDNSSESRYVSDTRGRANSICIRIRADVEISESGKKKLRLQKYPDKCRRMGPKNSFFLLFKWMMSVVQTLMPQNEIDS